MSIERSYLESLPLAFLLFRPPLLKRVKFTDIQTGNLLHFFK